MKALGILFIGLLLVTPARGEPNYPLHCVYTPRSQEIQRDCDHVDDTYQGGCSQFLSRIRPQLWSSRDYSSAGGGPSFGLVGACEVPTERTSMGCKKLRFANTPGEWLLINQIIPQSSLILLDPVDPMAVPPAPTARSQWLAEWHCDQTENELPNPHDGAYGLFTFNQPTSEKMSSLDMDIFSSWDFWNDPNWMESYNVVAAGYLEMTGSYGNPYSPGSPEHVIHSMKKFWAIFDDVYQLSTDGRALTGRGVAQVYMGLYGYYDPAWLRDQGLPDSDFDDPALSAAFDHLFECEDHLPACDPLVMIGAIDVGVEEGTWGQIKYLWNDYFISERRITAGMPRDPSLYGLIR